MYDLATAKLRLGKPVDPSTEDTMITLAMDAAMQFAESYCDRKFTSQVDSETFVHVQANTISLRRFPITTVNQITVDGNILAPNLYQVHYHADNQVGLIMFDAAIFCHALIVDYEGGFSVLPADLEMVLWRLFDWAWGNISAGGTEGVQPIGAVKALTIPDVGRVEFSTNNDNSFGGGAASSPYQPVEFLGSLGTILDFYRRWQV